MATKQETAVEQLIKELTEVERNLINKTYLHLNNSLAGIKLKAIFDKAKEIEKQQIINAVEWNYKSNMGEIYYDATFKKNKDQLWNSQLQQKYLNTIKNGDWVKEMI